MFSGHKTFSTFNGSKAPLRFVRINRVLDVFAMGKKLQIIQPVVRSIQIFVVDFHSFWDKPNKRFPHCAVNRYFDVFSVFARAKANIMIAPNVCFDGSSAAVTRPRFAVFNIKRSGNASVKKNSYFAKCSAVNKHGFGRVNLFGGKPLSTCHTPHRCKIADLVQTFIATNGFPNLHTVDIKPVYVRSQH